MIHEHPIPRSIGIPWTDHLLRVLMDGLPLAVCLHDGSGTIVDFNEHATKLWGGTPPPGERAGRYAGFHQLYAPDGAPVPLAASPVAHVIETGQAMVDVDLVGERDDGSMRPLLISVLPLSERGLIAGAISCFHDAPVSQPEDLGEPQEWEIMSSLCGSLGHDLANLFQSVRLNVNLAERRGGGVHELEKPLHGVGLAADRGLALTRQLLAYAGRQHMDCASTDINRLLAGLAPQLAALAGPPVRVKLRQGAQLWPAHADPEQMKHAVINVVTNACEALKGSGEIIITTAPVTLPAEHGIRAAGDYVAISIVDTGPGMDRNVLANAFHPFFTTKRGAKGLGLSTTLGIMRQQRGDIHIESHPGQGTCVTLTLPRSWNEPLNDTLGSEPGSEASSDFTVLVVDDDTVVRAAAVDILETEGFDVLASAGGDEALEILRSFRPVDLLLTDVHMAPMNGIDLLYRARALRPGLRSILISGYGDVKVGPLEHVTILQKPVRADEFLRRVRQALFRPAPAP